MPTFTYTKFGTHTLPIHNPRISFASAPILSSVAKLPGGGFYDGYGSEDAPESFPYELQYRASYRNTTIPATDAQQIGWIHTFVDQAKALVGVRDKLYRTDIYDSLTDGQWCYARLKHVDADREIAHKRILPMAYLFEVLTPWYGVLNEKGGDLIGTGSPYSVACANGGNRRATDIQFDFTVHGSSTPIVTAISVYRNTPDTTIGWAGSLTDGQGLRIDFGEKSVEKVAVGGSLSDEYANATLDALYQGEWLVLEVGNNTLYVSWSGTGTITPDILFTYYDRWA